MDSEKALMDSIAGILTLAEVRCLVIATLHTLNPRHTVERLVDIFPLQARGPIRKQLAAVLRGMVTMSRDDDGNITTHLSLVEETQREAIRMDDLERLE
jgi:Tfp pilus assembly pilus retraction ATPase PilT